MSTISQYLQVAVNRFEIKFMVTNTAIIIKVIVEFVDYKVFRKERCIVKNIIIIKLVAMSKISNYLQAVIIIVCKVNIIVAQQVFEKEMCIAEDIFIATRNIRCLQAAINKISSYLQVIVDRKVFKKEKCTIMGKYIKSLWVVMSMISNCLQAVIVLCKAVIIAVHKVFVKEKSILEGIITIMVESLWVVGNKICLHLQVIIS